MGAIDKDRHRPWLAYALEESLGRSLLAPRDVIEYANPSVLVTQLPPAVISDLLSRALVAGTFSPAQVLESAPPALLAEHLDPDVMWRCLMEAAERGGLSRKGAARSAPARQWFASVLERALDTDLISPADVVRFLPPPEFVGDAPRAVMAELIKAALGRASFDPALVLQHITPSVIADHLETSLVWACIAEAAARHFELGAPARGDEPSTAKVTAPIAAAAPAKPTPKAIDKDKQATVEKRVPPLNEKVSEKTLVSGGVAASSTARPSASNVIAGRAEIAPARAAAPVVVTAPVAAVAAPASIAAPARGEITEWSPADDLDVLEDQPLPFPLPR
jgi:hypothetical protein